MKITAKAMCNLKQVWGEDDTRGMHATLGFCPDYMDGRNKEWADATPHLDVRMTVNGKSLIDSFEVGQKYTITFEVTD